MLDKNKIKKALPTGILGDMTPPVSVKKRINRDTETYLNELRTAITQFFYYTVDGIKARNFLQFNLIPHLDQKGWLSVFRTNKEEKDAFILGMKQFYSELLLYPINTGPLRKNDDPPGLLAVGARIKKELKSSCPCNQFRDMCWASNTEGNILFPYIYVTENGHRALTQRQVIVLAEWNFVTLALHNYSCRPETTKISLAKLKGRIAAARHLLRLDHTCLTKQT